MTNARGVASLYDNNLTVINSTRDLRQAPRIPMMDKAVSSVPLTIYNAAPTVELTSDSTSSI